MSRGRTQSLTAYRFITGPNDAAFCHRVTALLNKGWEISGSAVMSFDHQSGKLMCGQALVKQIDGLEYAPDLELDTL